MRREKPTVQLPLPKPMTAREIYESCLANHKDVAKHMAREALSD